MTSNLTLLVVEDDPILKNLLGHTFSGAYALRFASNGEEALEFLKEQTPALILLDLMMPGMDGFTFMEQLRAHPDENTKNVPIIVVSNVSQEKDMERAKALGAREYLVKAEVSVEEIVAKVQEVLGAAA